MEKATTPEHNTATTRLNQNQMSVTDSSNSDEISLIDLILILWKGKYIIAACTVIATVLAVIYALTATEIFSTSTTFILKTKGSGGGGNLGQLAAMAGLNMGSNNNVDPSDYLDKIIQDKEFIAKLYEKKWFFKGDSLPLEQIFELEPDTTVPNSEYAFFMKKINAVRNGGILSINKDAKTGILTLTSNAPDPQLAYDLNLFTLNYISNYIRKSLKSQAKEKRVFIEERIKETKEELTKAENALAKFKERNLVSQAPKVMLEEGRLRRQVTLNQEIYIQFQKQYELTRIEELDDQALVQVVKSAEVPIVKSKPNRKMIVIVTFITGIFLGFLFVFLNNLLKTLVSQNKQ
ncbi:MAG TPA: Wzz/FepE/Etk N-terminal domain-containing protein [Chitinispirillaceae bacterium]|nr:Wzz/FepE/Etk N-terminal domain-containing protein [Chitinispirillaceae bacterium]